MSNGSIDDGDGVCYSGSDSDDSQLERSDSMSSMTSTIHMQIQGIQKAGYLQKRGGKDKKQSWRRRWFTFDGKALKYFHPKKTVSLRVVPVSIMKSVKHVQDLSRRLSAADILGSSSKDRQHQFELECKNRTFLFGTNKLEDCIDWLNNLQAAILAYEKDAGSTEAPHGGEMSNPDISGMIKFNNSSRKYFVALKDDKLKYYWDEEDYSYDSPIHEISMLLTSVKEIDKLTLELNGTPDQKLCLKLRFDCCDDAAIWFTMISTAIYNILCSQSEIVDNVRQTAANRTCADCTATDNVVWASINLGVVLCRECAGRHRALGVRTSKIRSLQMDNIFKENVNILKLLHAMGNENANKYWYKHPPDGRIIDRSTPPMVRMRHIQQKYVQKAFVDTLSESKNANVDETFVSAVKRGDIVEVMLAFHAGANIYSFCPKTSQSSIELAKELGFDAIKEYLEQNEFIDVSAKDALTDQSNGHATAEKKQNIYFEGYLEKTGPNLRGFLKRRCVLNNRELSYYDESSKSKERGCFLMSDVCCVCAAACKRSGCFDVSNKSNKRVYRFAAADKDLRRHWMIALARAMTTSVITLVDDFEIAGYFYTKTHASQWRMSWMSFNGKTVSITLMDDQKEETVHLSKGVQLFQCNMKIHKSQKDDQMDMMVLNGNQRIEIVPQDHSGFTCIQGQMLEDTNKLFHLLDEAVK